jgi:potassium/hydrogen antiporter
MSTIVLVTGLMVFLSHFLSILFRKTNVPDVLVLMAVGLLLGPVFGLVDAQDFGKIGPVIATIALVVILFEGGTSLRIDVMMKSLATTGKFAMGCFLMTAGVVSGLGFWLLDLAVLPATLLGMILAGTSSAVVIPMVESLRLGKKAGTVLVLESALTDVLCIVGVFALLQIFSQGHVEPGRLIGSVLSSLVFAAVIGILGGLGWLLILGKVRDFPNTISATIAYAFIVYGVAEFLGFSGAIAAMALGITLTNFDQMGLTRLKFVRSDMEPLTDVERSFYREAVFLLKTYFFIYLGISIRFQGWMPVLVAGMMMGLVFLLRTGLTRLTFQSRDFSARDAALASMMAPKGLAAAVLPLQHGVPGAEVIRDTAYMVVLVSITLCAVLVALYPTGPMTRAYRALLGKPDGQGAPVADGQAEK